MCESVLLTAHFLLSSLILLVVFDIILFISLSLSLSRFSLVLVPRIIYVLGNFNLNEIISSSTLALSTICLISHLFRRMLFSALCLVTFTRASTIFATTIRWSGPQSMFKLNDEMFVISTTILMEYIRGFLIKK